jgi:multicomponent Na+:H+ antiporter subunit G
VDTVGDLLLVLGAALMLIAAIGVVRFPDLYSRMHAATKATAAGLLLVSLGAAVVLGEGWAKLVATVALVLLTSPVAAHLIGRAAYRAEGVPLRVDTVDELADTRDDPIGG